MENRWRTSFAIRAWTTSLNSPSMARPEGRSRTSRRNISHNFTGLPTGTLSPSRAPQHVRRGSVARKVDGGGMTTKACFPLVTDRSVCYHASTPGEPVRRRGRRGLRNSKSYTLPRPTRQECWRCGSCLSVAGCREGNCVRSERCANSRQEYGQEQVDDEWGEHSLGMPGARRRTGRFWLPGGAILPRMTR